MATSFPRFSPTLVQFCQERGSLSLPALRDRERGARTGLLPPVRFRVCKNFGIKARCIVGAIFSFCTYLLSCILFLFALRYFVNYAPLLRAVCKFSYIVCYFAYFYLGFTCLSA